MNLYIRWGIIAALLVLSVILGREYTKYREQRLRQMRAFGELVLHIRGQVSRFLSPTRSLLDGFSSDELSRIGFTSEFERSRDLSAALEGANTSLGEGYKKILSEFFSGFGREYKDGEVTRADHYIELLGREEEREREESQKSVKLTKTLLLASALALAILLI